MEITSPTRAYLLNKERIVNQHYGGNFDLTHARYTIKVYLVFNCFQNDNEVMITGIQPLLAITRLTKQKIAILPHKHL